MAEDSFEFVCELHEQHMEKRFRKSQITAERLGLVFKVRVSVCQNFIF